MTAGDPQTPTALGWYTFRDRIYISTAFLQDRYRLAEVLNHEQTHNVLASTTSFGFVQRVIATVAPAPWEEEDSRLRALAGLLTHASREAQEAAATFAGLSLMPHDLRKELVELLPGDYQTAFGSMETFLAARSFTPERQLTLARALSARALQTDLLAAWHRLSLMEPRNLASYLAGSDQNPNIRLKQIFAALESATDEELDSWTGRFVMDRAGRLSLQPPCPPQLTDVTFAGLPDEEQCEADGHAIIRGLVRVGETERARRARSDLREMLTKPWRPRLVLAPADHTTLTDLPLAEAEWHRQVDLVVMRANLLHLGIVDRSDLVGDSPTLQPGQVVIFAHRPDFLRAPGFITTQRDLLERFSAIKADRDCAIAVDLFSALPSEYSRLKGQNWDVVDWLPTRRVLLTTHGELHQALAMFTVAREEPHLWFALAITEAWAIVLVRRESQPWPAIIYPTFVHTLADELGALAQVFPLRESEDNHRFFADESLLRHALRYARMYHGLVVAPDRWKVIEQLELDGLFSGERPGEVIGLGPGTPFGSAS